MNRATKRLLAKQEAQAERERARQTPLTRADAKRSPRTMARSAGSEGPRESRLKRFRRFLKEVRVELRKVAWPSRGEVVTYTVVVLVSVMFVTVLVFGLDFGFGKMISEFFTK